jgi:hypothetical protein
MVDPHHSLWLITKIEPPKFFYGVEFGGEEVMIVDDDDSASKGLGFRV